MVGKVIKEVAEAVIKQGGETVPAKIKITEEVRAPFRELGLKPMPRDGGGLRFVRPDWLSSGDL
jgi:hypothetical protein